VTHAPPRRYGRASRWRPPVLEALLVLLLVLGSVASAPAAGDKEVPPELQAVILSRALSFDDALKYRVGDNVTAAILYRPGDEPSESLARHMLKAWKALGGGDPRIGGLPVRIILLAFVDPAALSTGILTEGVDVLYVCPGLEPKLSEISRITRQRLVISIGSRQEHVVRGLSMGVFVVKDHGAIFINLAAAKSEGANFSFDLLRLAVVIR
jgi:hypothetical protein